MKVNFFIVGGPRCGTSALAKYLSEHPDCGFSIPKEPWFFCNDFQTGYPDHLESLDEYHQKCFGHLGDGKYRAIGEASPIYLCSDVAAQKILDYNPDARFIVMLRNPIDIVQAMHRGRVQHGPNHESLANLKDAWVAQESRSTGAGLPPGQIKPILLQYKAIASQGTPLKRLMELAGSDKVHVIFFEDLNKSFVHEYQRTLDFLGLDPYEPEVIERVLPTTTWKYEIVGKAYRFLQNCADILPYKPKFGILKRLKTNLSTTEKPSIDPSIKNTMLESFLPEIEIIEQLTKRDLSHWKK